MIHARSDDDSQEAKKVILFRQVVILPLYLFSTGPVDNAHSARTRHQIKSKDVFHFRFIGVYLQPLARNTAIKVSYSCTKSAQHV